MSHPLQSMVPEFLDPKNDTNGTLTFQCPRCFATNRRRAFSYTNNPTHIFCSSTGCIRGEKFTEVFSKNYKPSDYPAQKKRSQRKRATPIPPSQLNKFIMSNRGSKLDQGAQDYILSRLPGLSQKRALSIFFDIEKSPYSLDKYHHSIGYTFAIPLFDHESTKAISYQVYGPSKKPKAKTCVSLGNNGAGFAPSVLLADRALLPKENERSHFILSEGVFDFSTLKLLDKNVQGIAGVSQARKAISAMTNLGFTGSVYIALDADDAGQRETEKLEKIYRYDPNVCLYDASPKVDLFPELFLFNEKPDINDVYVFYEKEKEGGGRCAIDKLLKFAKPLFDEENEGRRRLKLAHQITRKLGAYEKPVKGESLLEYFKELGVTPKGKKLYLEDLGIEIERASNVGKIYRAAHCGSLGKTECSFDPKNFHESFKLSKKSWAAENNYCHHCLAAWWNSVVVPELLKQWPEHLYTLTIPFDNREDLEVKKRRILARVSGKVSRHLGYSVNTIEGCLYVYTDVRPGEVKSGRKRPKPRNPIINVPPDVKIPPLLEKIKEATKIEYLSREEVIKGPFKQSWFSTPRYVRSVVREAINQKMGYHRFTSRLKNDEYLKKKLCRYGFRKKGKLEIPSMEAFRSSYRLLCKEIRERQEELEEIAQGAENSDDKIERDDTPITNMKLHVLSNEDSRTFFYMSARSPSATDMKRLLHAEELKIRLGEEPNYLRVTHTWPIVLRENNIKPVDVARKIAAHNGWEDFSILSGDSKHQYKTVVTPREEIEAHYLSLSERGYDPRIHGSVDEFLERYREGDHPPDS